MDPAQRAPELIERLRAEVEKAPGGRLTDKELCRARDRSLDRAAAVQAPLRHDLPGLSPRAPDGARAARSPQRRAGSRKCATGAASNRRAGFAKRSPGSSANRRRRRKSATACSRERIETPLGAMLAIADDDGLAPARVCRSPRARARAGDSARASREQTSSRASIVISTAMRAAAGRLFLGKESGVRRPARAGRLRFPDCATWETSASIPLGETRSYSWMAEQLGDPGARRAVGRANGTNMMSHHHSRAIA